MFIYYNINPNGEKIGDCVVRAISLALHKSYEDVISMLLENSKYFNCDIIVKDCYSILLSQYQFITPNNKTAQEIASEYKENVLLIRTAQHLTCAMYGDIYDIWDCSNEIADCFWIIK